VLAFHGGACRRPRTDQTTGDLVSRTTHDAQIMASHSPAMIANEFVKQYYSILVNDRAKLHRFYCDASYTMRGEDTQDAELVSGVDGIKRLIDSSIPITKVDYTHVDVQMSSNSGVVLLVTGSVRLASGSWRSFVQNFFLSPQTKTKANYFVINDTFRLLAAPSQAWVADQNRAPAPVKTQPRAGAPPPAAPPAPEASAEPTPQVEPSDGARAAKALATEAEPAVSDRGVASALTYAQMAAMYAQSSAQNAPKPKPKAPPAPTEDGAGRSGQETAPSAAPTAEDKVSHSIFVKGLLPEVTEEDLRQLFLQFGDIVQVNFRENRDFAFIEFKEAQAATKSLERTGELQLKGCSLSLEPRHPKPAPGSGGSKGRGRGRGKGGRGEGNDRGGRGKSGRGGRGRRPPATTA